MKVLALSGAARRLKSSRGVYRKKTNRDRDVRPAWKIGDPVSFAKAKSITMERICLDPNLGGKAKAVLANCLKRMNCHEQWSCFVSIERLAEDSQTSKPTCWRAIHDADGIYIATKTGRRSKSQCYPSTHITIHPGMVSPMRPSMGDRVAPVQNQSRIDAKTGSHGCDKNFLHLTSFTELPKDSKFEIEGKKEEGIRDRLLEFQNLQARKRGNREERFLPKASSLCRDLEFLQGREIRVEADGGYAGRWFDAQELADALGIKL